MTPDPWPWPGDSPLDRRSRVARTYRDALAEVAPERCAELDETARRFGQGWILPSLLTYQPEELLTAQEVAEMCNVQPDTVRQWRKRGLRTVGTPDGARYLVADVLEYHAQIRYRRARRGVNP